MATTIFRKVKLFLIYGLPVILIGLVGIAFVTSSPLRIGPVGVLVVFLLLYMFTATTLYALFFSFLSILGRFVAIGSSMKKYLLYVTNVIALALVLLLALRTISQLDARDFTLVFVFVLAICFYIFRRLN